MVNLSNYKPFRSSCGDPFAYRSFLVGPGHFLTTYQFKWGAFGQLTTYFPKGKHLIDKMNSWERRGESTVLLSGLEEYFGVDRRARSFGTTARGNSSGRKLSTNFVFVPSQRR